MLRVEAREGRLAWSPIELTVDDMNGEQETWDRLQSLFEQAIHVESKQRPAFLEQACGEDDWLRNEVESLLNSFHPAEKELDMSPVPNILSHVTEMEIRHDAIPGYEIHREIRRGGQGIVCRAVQLATGREVALKIMLDGPFASRGQPTAIRTGSRTRQQFASLEYCGDLRSWNRGWTVLLRDGLHPW